MKDLAEAPWALRFWAYLQERFPPAAYGVLVALFFGSAVLVARSLGGGDGVWWPGGLIMLLAFFHLRVFDEHKDYDSDVVAYPERVLSQGLVTLPQLRNAGVVAIAVEAVLAFGGGSTVGLAWLGTFVFTLLMAREFFVGSWLSRHIVLYAISHNPVVAGLALVGWACTGTELHPAFWAYVAMVSFGSLAFEVGRKFRLPTEEIDGVESYTSALGRARALLLLRGSMLLACTGLLILLRQLDGAVVQGWNALVPDALGLKMWGSLLWSSVPLVVGAALAHHKAPARKVELGATLLLFLVMLISGAFAWA